MAESLKTVCFLCLPSHSVTRHWDPHACLNLTAINVPGMKRYCVLVFGIHSHLTSELISSKNFPRSPLRVTASPSEAVWTVLVTPGRERNLPVPHLLPMTYSAVSYATGPFSLCLYVLYLSVYVYFGWVNKTLPYVPYMSTIRFVGRQKCIHTVCLPDLYMLANIPAINSCPQKPVWQTSRAGTVPAMRALDQAVSLSQRRVPFP